MGRKLGRIFINHLKDNLGLYITMSLFLLIGIFLGSLGVKGLGSEEEGELLEYLNYFFAGFADMQVEPLALLKQSLNANYKLLAMIWFLGLTVLGAPLIFLVIAIRGFYLGFTAGFLIQEKALLGILLTVLTLVPQNLFNLPALVAAAVLAASFSLWLVKGRNREPAKGLFQQFLLYTILLSCLAVLMLFGSLLEAYITPQLLRLVLEYY